MGDISCPPKDTNPVYVKESHRCAVGTNLAPGWFFVRLAAESVNALGGGEGEEVGRGNVDSIRTSPALTYHGIALILLEVDSVE